MNVSRLAAFVPSACLLAVTACSGAAPVLSGAAPGQADMATRVSGDITPPYTGQIFVSAGRVGHGGILNEVDIYQKGPAHALLGKITKGISGANGMTMDAAGNLYVSNVGNATITKYAPGSVTPSVTYRSQLTNPLTLTMGTDGTLYAVNYYPPGQGSAIFEYAPGATSPTTKIKLPGGAEGMALDANNNLYVGYNTNFSEVIKFAPGSKTYVDTGIRVGFVGCVLVDNKGNLLVCDQIAPSINVYKPGATTPFKTISTSGMVNPYLAAFGKDYARLYVADSASSTFDIFDYPSGTLAGQIQRTNTSYGVAVTPGTL